MKNRYKKSIIYTAIIIVSAVVYLFAGYLYYNSQKNSIRKDRYEELHNIAVIKSDQLVSWQQERLSEASFFTRTYPYSLYINEFIKGNFKGEDFLNSALPRIMSNNRYVNIFVLDSSGRIIFSVYEQDNDINEVTLQGSRSVFESAEIKVIDFYFCEVHKEVHLEIIAPVFDNNEVVATMVFMVNPLDNIFALVQQWPGAGKTAESMIVRARGDSVDIVNELRFVPNSSLKYSFPLSDSQNPAVMPFLGYTGMQQGVDYSGDRVLCDIVEVPGTDWYLIVKINESEIFSELKRRGFLLILITILIIGLSVGTISWIYNNRQRNLFKELADQKELYKVITDNISDVVWIADLNFNISYVSKSIEKMTGESVTEHLSKSITEKLPPESISIVMNALSEELAREREQGVDKSRTKVFEVQHYHADGRLIWIGMNVSFLRDESGNIFGIQGISRDITNLSFASKKPTKILHKKRHREYL